MEETIVLEAVESTEALTELLERASSQGFITYDEILEALPEVEERLDVLEELFSKLRELDIPVQDQSEDADEETEMPPSRVISAKDEDDLALARCSGSLLPANGRSPAPHRGRREATGRTGGNRQAGQPKAGPRQLRNAGRAHRTRSRHGAWPASAGA